MLPPKIQALNLEQMFVSVCCERGLEGKKSLTVRGFCLPLAGEVLRSPSSCYQRCGHVREGESFVYA